MARVVRIIALLAACALGSGCAAGTGAKGKGPGDKQSAAPSRSAARSETHVAPVVVQSAVPAKPVREGPAPLVYLLPASGTLRVVDKSDGRDLATTAAAARAILRVDERTGVQLGQQTLVKGPLPAGHEYVVYLSTDSMSEVRHDVRRPGSR